MTQEFWNIVLSRITRSQPVDLDQEFFESGPHQAAPIENIVPFNQARCLPPSKVFWTHGNGLNSCIGVRVDELLPDTTVAATRLAAAALERGVNPVIMSSLPDCGFEQFGFRVERLVGSNQEELAACELDLVQFWNMAIVIDVKDIARLG